MCESLCRVCAAPLNVVTAVEGGHRAIVFNRLVGVKDDVIGEGLHVRWPWLEWPIIYDVRTKPQKFASPTGTKGTGSRHLSRCAQRDPFRVYILLVFWHHVPMFKLHLSLLCCVWGQICKR